MIDPDEQLRRDLGEALDRAFYRRLLPTVVGVMVCVNLIVAWVARG